MLHQKCGVLLGESMLFRIVYCTVLWRAIQAFRPDTSSDTEVTEPKVLEETWLSGIMEKKMETTIIYRGYRVYIGVILG